MDTFRVDTFWEEDEDGNQGVFCEMEGWDSDTFESVAKDYYLKLEDEWEGY